MFGERSQSRVNVKATDALCQRLALVKEVRVSRRYGL